MAMGLPSLGIDEVVKNRDLWRGLMAEFVGTFLLVMIACGSGVSFDESGHPAMHGALAAGLAVVVIVYSISHVSGGHINPAVTFAMFTVGKISLLRAVFYVITQCVGAILGATVIHGVTPEHLRHDIGVTRVNQTISSVQGFGVEFLITFVLLLTVFAVCDANRPELKGFAALAIGLSVTACHLFAIPYTGSGMNPARSFGPAMMANAWAHHWVYWVGPCLGGTAAGILYDCLLKAPEKKPIEPDSKMESVSFLKSEKDAQDNGEELYKTSSI